MTRPTQRGSALLITLIALAVLMLLVVAAIQFTSTNREGAGSKLRGDELASCAESARRTLMQQLTGANLTASLQDQTAKFPTVTLVDQAILSDRSTVGLGHYSGADGGSSSTNPAISTITADTIPGSTKDARDMSNTIAAQSGLGGSPYRVIMTCRDRGGRETEVEFMFRFGI